MVEIIDNAQEHRFEWMVEGQLVFLDYRRAQNRLELIHTYVPASLRGRHIGTEFVRAVLEKIRRSGLKVVPKCEFVAAYIQGHSEFEELA